MHIKKEPSFKINDVVFVVRKGLFYIEKCLVKNNVCNVEQTKEPCDLSNFGWRVVL